MKCIECEYLSIDGRFEHSVGVIECGCAYDSNDGRWNFSIGYISVSKPDTIYDEGIIIEQHKKCPLNEGILP